MTLKELLAQRLKLIADARALLDKAEKEKRSLTPEESQAYDKQMDEADRLLTKAKELQTQEERKRRLESAEGNASGMLPRQTDDRGVGDNSDSNRGGAGSHGELRYTPRGARSERVFRFHGAAGSTEYREAFGRFLRDGDQVAVHECRELTAGVATQGGYLVMPQQMAAGILRAVDDQTFIRRLATVIQVPTAASLGVPTQETNPSDPDWTAEVAEVNEDTSQAFGKRELKPVPLSKAVDVSRKLLRMVPEIDGFIQERLGYKFGIAMEKAYISGNGANQPLGVFTASAMGVSTARDVTCGSTTAITDTGLIDMLYGLKAGYRDDPSCAWLFHRSAMAQIRKLKDNQGGYLWKPGQGLESNVGDTLLGKPVNESEYVPNTFTSGLYVGMIAAWRYYWIADSLQMEVQRLNELLARRSLVEFIGRAESDGMPTIEEAFVRGKLA